MPEKPETLADAIANARTILEEDSWIDEITLLDEDGEPDDYAQKVVRMSDMAEAINRIEAAAKRAGLDRSTPTRNCDVGTASEQAARFDALCIRCNHCTECPVHALWGEFSGKPKSCQLIWAQLPYVPSDGKEADHA